ncbi:winged helix-turn-helix transcriptional regulator [Streptomyces sp. AC536]|uniref:MarR family winged helix-turn-helix transcriptional regulator n=1 Tax=Streptomyces buecherae TaxID=2763006 RepID=UPI00164D739B|nr:MarR family winged helix-turn-helix transcriptional regulator [Streptomyces buecherae]MBC3985437.1 winged helix-turn-helix transcriptional regulator [Streptomyces buecherae]QNJ42624.1 winged helix-turn-helix transcriptional regulator [Streptomyces buecherae]
MEFSHSDEELVKQPIGYWSWAASQAVVTYIRAGLSGVGLTQPQWWTLHQVAEHPAGRTREEITAVLQGYLDIGADLEPEIDATLERGLLESDDEERLHFTEAGEALYAQAAEIQRASRETVHEGVTDAEFLTTMKVLQRMIHNTGGEAWHH